MGDEPKWTSMEDIAVYQRMEATADEVWSTVFSWSPFGRDTMGSQFARATDSVLANLAEGDGRYHHADKLRFLYIARGSLKEAQFWLRRAQMRRLVGESVADRWASQFEQTRRWLNGLITQRRKWADVVREPMAGYGNGGDQIPEEEGVATDPSTGAPILGSSVDTLTP